MTATTTTCQFRMGQRGMTWHCGRYTKNGAQFCTEHDTAKCGCDEYPECTHVLYWHEGFKAGMSRGCEREQFETVLGQADYNSSCTKLHYVFHPDSKFQVGERVRVVIEKLTSIVGDH